MQTFLEHITSIDALYAFAYKDIADVTRVKEHHLIRKVFISTCPPGSIIDTQDGFCTADAAEALDRDTTHRI